VTAPAPERLPRAFTPVAVQVAAAQQRAQTASTVAAVMALWSLMGDDFDSSWRRIRDGVLTLLLGGQVGAARAGARSTAAVLTELGIGVDPVAEVVPEAFGGWAADGRSLESLVDLAPVRAKQAVAGGASSREALAAGASFVETVAESEVGDAGRGAEQVAIVARPGIGWVRMVNVPCCPRCAILAGRFYRYSDGFLRHQQCSCRHIPALESVAEDLVVNPDRLFAEGQVRGLTNGQRAAIEGGANINRVVNASRDMARMGASPPRGRRLVPRRATPTNAVDAGGGQQAVVDRLRGMGFLA